MNYQQHDNEFEQSAAGWWIRLVGIIVYMAIIVAYALQTLALVAWLFPGGDWFMKVATVFVCDGCATGYAMTEMFYRFRLRKSKSITFGMWIVTFILSTAATVVQMYLSSTHNIPHAIDPGIIELAYGLIITAFVVNIIAITAIIRLEHGASLPPRVYLDDGPKKRAQILGDAAGYVSMQPVAIAAATPQARQVAAAARPAQLPAPQPRATVTAKSTPVAQAAKPAAKPLPKATIAKPLPKPMPAPKPEVAQASFVEEEEVGEEVQEIIDQASIDEEHARVVEELAQEYGEDEEEGEETQELPVADEEQEIAEEDSGDGDIYGAGTRGNYRVPLTQRVAGAFQALTAPNQK